LSRIEWFENNGYLCTLFEPSLHPIIIINHSEIIVLLANFAPNDKQPTKNDRTEEITVIIIIIFSFNSYSQYNINRRDPIRGVYDHDGPPRIVSGYNNYRYIIIGTRNNDACVTERRSERIRSRSSFSAASSAASPWLRDRPGAFRTNPPQTTKSAHLAILFYIITFGRSTIHLKIMNTRMQTRREWRLK